MPELPEVEQLTVGVRNAAMGAKFVSIQFFRDDIREPISKKEIEIFLLLSSIINVFRRGKYMIVETPNGGLGVHLGMSGKFLWEEKGVPVHPHTHAIFSLKSAEGSIFHYHYVDPRRFGRLFPITSSQLRSRTHPFFDELGVEPLDHDLNLSKHLLTRFKTKSQPIKSALMDNRNIVGVGNIYACESLWRAGIHPMKPAKTILAPAIEILSQKIRDVLSQAIAMGGTTFRDYRDSQGKLGKFQELLNVYEREGLPCNKCRRKVQRITQAGRSTYFCATCQK